MQAASAYSLKVQGWLREEALDWATRIDTDIAAKEKDTEATKQERQRDLIRLKVCCIHCSDGRRPWLLGAASCLSSLECCQSSSKTKLLRAAK